MGGVVSGAREQTQVRLLAKPWNGKNQETQTFSLAHRLGQNLPRENIPAFIEVISYFEED
jgi:hypothetical protein